MTKPIFFIQGIEALRAELTADQKVRVAYAERDGSLQASPQAEVRISDWRFHIEIPVQE